MRQFFSLFLALCLLGGLCACGQTSPKSEKSQIDFYYTVSEGETSGAAIRSETKVLSSTEIPDVMDQLLQGPLDTVSLSSIFPRGTALQDWSLEEGVLWLDLSEAFSRLSGISLTYAEYCIVLTMTQLDGVDAVTLTADGKMLPGAASTPLRATDVILSGETKDPFTMGIQLYFPLQDGSGLGVEYRELQIAEDEVLSQSNAVLQEMLAGTGEEEMSSFLTDAGQLSVVSVEQGLCTVSIDQRTLDCLCNPEGDFQLALYAIVDSLAELEGIDRVEFLLEDKPIDDWDSAYEPVYEF